MSPPLTSGSRFVSGRSLEWRYVYKQQRHRTDQRNRGVGRGSSPSTSSVSGAFAGLLVVVCGADAEQSRGRGQMALLCDDSVSEASFFIAIIGGRIVTANWCFLLTSLLPFAFIVARTRIEEEKLVERFGDEYRDYMARTGQFFPRLR